MLKTIIRLSAASLLLLSLPAMADPAKLKFAWFSDDKEMTYVSAIKPFADKVNDEAKGVVEIEFFMNGALGRDPRQQAQLVLDGVADMTFVIPGATPGRFPDSSVMELPGYFDTLEACSRGFSALVGDGQNGKIADYADYFVIGAFTPDPFMFQSHVKITGLADLKNKKFRVSNQTQAEVLKQLGAVPLLIPVTEVVEAIGRGTIDGAGIALSPATDWGITRVTSYHYALSIGCSPVLVIMNRKVFDGLPKSGQDVIRKYSGTWFVDKYLDGYGAYFRRIYAELKADPKRTVIEPTAADLAAAKVAYKPVIDDWMTKRPRNPELFQAMTEVSARLATEDAKKP
jgi:TRAP-type C4-dicarboxylate transport system substrate-binding protein